MHNYSRLISQSWLDDFFSQLDGDILKRKEGQTIEFKSEFEWSNGELKSTYLKTIASFGNAKGGYLIFGIEKKPHKICGCSGFVDIDIAQIVDTIQKYFHCDIPIEKDLTILKGKEIGVIAVHECPGKPAICIKDAQNSKNQFLLKEGAIYYRYAGKSSEIKSGDLINLIESAKEKINQKWMSTLSRISSTGISNVGIMDTATGLLKVNDSAFLISEDLVKQLKIIDSYSESSDGAPALKIIGAIEGTARVIRQNKTIEEYEVIQEFLERKGNFDYTSLLERIPNFPSFAYPFFYFLNRISKSREEYIKYILQTPKFSEETPFIKKMLIGYESWLMRRRKAAPLSKTGKKGQKRIKFFEIIKSNSTYVFSSPDDRIAFCEACFHLEKENFDSEKIRQYLFDIFTSSYKLTPVAKAIREACCAIDILEYN